MRIYPAKEKTPTEINISELLDNNGALSLIEKSKKYFDIDYRKDKLMLVAGGHIGTIPVTKNIAINVEPKFTISNLTHLISKSNKNLKYLDFFKKHYKSTNNLSPPIFEFLCACLLDELHSIDKEGIYRKYQKKYENTSFPKGGIKIGRTITENWSKGRRHKVIVEYFDFDINNPFNQLIKYALWYCLRHLEKIETIDGNIRPQLKKYYDYFQYVNFKNDRSFLGYVEHAINNDKLPKLRHYYKSICQISILIIEDSGIELQSAGEDVRASSFIVDMSYIFETYLLNILKVSDVLQNSELTILDGNKEGKGWLLNDSDVYAAKPDIIIMKNNETSIIIDAKYKGKLNEQDRYQIISHSLSYGASIAILISPVTDNGSTGLTRLGAIGKTHEIELFTYQYDLNADSLETEEDYLIQVVNSLCSSV